MQICYASMCYNIYVFKYMYIDMFGKVDFAIRRNNMENDTLALKVNILHQFMHNFLHVLMWND